MEHGTANKSALFHHRTAILKLVYEIGSRLPKFSVNTEYRFFPKFCSKFNMAESTENLTYVWHQ